MDAFTTTARTRVRRLPQRAVYDRAQVYAILDEGFICHVGFTVNGRPYVLPTCYARMGDQLCIHGSAVGRIAGARERGAELCVTVTLVDGLVLARSAFHHSVNYRSVVVFGQARAVTDPQEKLEALRRITNHAAPGRWEETRPPSEPELNATSVIAIPLQEASAKVRTGPPADDERDYSWPVWAGVVPLRTVAGEPVPDGRVLAGVPVFDTGRLAQRPESSR